MLTLREVQNLMSELRGWSIQGNAIEKSYELENFISAIDFVNKLAFIANEQNHHPEISISYNKVHLSITTHLEKGLSKKDFLLAKEIDKI